MNELIIIIALILLNGILAMSEIALISVRKSHLAKEEKKGSKNAKIALKLANEPDNFLSTVQIGITIIGILTGIYSGNALAEDFGGILLAWGVPETFARPLAQAIIVILVTYFTLVFGELVPKRIGMSVAEGVAKVVARPMHILSVVVSPFVWLLSKSTSFVYNLFGLKNDSGKVTEEEIKSMIEEGARDGEVQEVEQDIVERVFMLGDLKVSSLMTHRSDLIALDIRMDHHKIREILEQNLYEVYPVIDGSFDDVKGVITLKDLVFKFGNDHLDIATLIRPAVFFHENMSVYKALERMKEQKISQALICDEFGSCQGLISLKDILEGLVGNIDNVHTEPDIIERKEHNGWLVDGQCSFYDFLNYFEKEHLNTKNHYNTISGLILDRLDRIPESGDRLEWENLQLEVVDMDGARIDKILVSKIETEEG